MLSSETVPQEFAAAYVAAVGDAERRQAIRQAAGDWCEERGDQARTSILRGETAIPMEWCLGSDGQSFWLSTTHVTQSQWFSVIEIPFSEYVRRGTFDHVIEGSGCDYPMHYVSWDEADDFCALYSESEQKAGRLPSGLRYQLPTEAAWEIASVHNWSRTRLDEYAWTRKNSEGLIHPVATKKSNDFGFYDMYGNVAEWSTDRESVGNWAWGPEDPRRVVLGGAFCDPEYLLPWRYSTQPEDRLLTVGLRVCLFGF